MSELSKAYEPQSVEEKWYSHWIERGHFTAYPPSPQPPQSNGIPPPNAPRVLTLCHELTPTLQAIPPPRPKPLAHSY